MRVVVDQFVVSYLRLTEEPLGHVDVAFGVHDGSGLFVAQGARLTSALLVTAMLGRGITRAA